MQTVMSQNVLTKKHLPWGLKFYSWVIQSNSDKSFVSIVFYEAKNNKFRR